MLTRVILIFCFVSTALAADVDEFARAVAKFRAGDFAASRDLLSGLIKREPNNAVFWFNLGNAQFMLGDFNGSALSFERVRQTKSPLTPAALLYQAKAWRENGESKRARIALEALLARRDLPTGVREAAARDLTESSEDSPRTRALELYRKGRFVQALREIRAAGRGDEDLRLLEAMTLLKLNRADRARPLLAELERDAPSSPVRALGRLLAQSAPTTASRPVWAFVTADGGYDQNPRGSDAPEGSGTFALGLGLGAHVWAENLWYQNVSYTGSWNEVFAARDLTVVGHEVATSLGRAEGPRLALLTPYFYHESWGLTPARLAGGARVHLRDGNETFEYGLTGNWENGSPLTGGDETARGTRGGGRIYLGRIDFPFYYQIYFDVRAQNSGDAVDGAGATLPSAFIGFGPGGRLLWKWNPRWTWDVSLALGWRNYRGNPQPEDVARHDTETSVAIRVTRLLRPDFSVYLSSAFERGRSTLSRAETGGLNYDRTQFISGVMWDAF